MRTTILALLLLCVAPSAAVAQDEELKVPAEVRPFVEAGTKAIAVEAADLNGDGRGDFVLVLERENPQKDENDFPVNQRPLIILVRGADGKLGEAKRNERVVMCSRCGGVWGDPFEGVVAGRNGFSVELYGGSNWRWKYSYKFNYSRVDKTWQLVRAEEISYHTSDPDKMKTRVFMPPRDYGKIDIANFDPEKYKRPSKARARK
ncbi:MAG TPA: hypothetical protein VNZ44_08630 [Pyrinomonadaceae bacterium]|nr:hypothetical protein [Pyrinomonadaceae bacterium]